jgi:hypothetical protein
VLGFAGYPYSILRSYATGAVTGSTRVGGLVGETTASATSIAQVYATGTVTGTMFVGGLVGLNAVAIINAYATGAVTGTNSVGGLAGGSFSLIAHSFASGAVVATVSKGGLVGYIDSAQPLAVAPYSYWDTTTSGVATSAGGVGKTTTEMKSAASFPTWDTYTVWTLGGGYPTFRGTPVACVVGASGFSGGDGTPVNPYLVSQPAQLYNVGCNRAARFKLTADLDFTGQPMVPPIGTYTANEFAPNQPFSGGFDGNGKTISNWVYYGGSVGVFGMLANVASVHDLNLANLEVGGSFCVGTLVGFGDGSIDNVRASGSVGGLSFVGGIAGTSASGSAWSRLGSEVAVTAGASGGNANAGGVVGYHSGAISNSYSHGPVSGTTVGASGFAAFGAGAITNSYSTGAVLNGNGSGDGFAAVSGAVNSCYWDTQTSGQVTSTVGTGASTMLMQSQASFVGWDFATTWQSSAGAYPALR